MSLPASLELEIAPRARDLGEGFVVRRVLPFAQRRAVGPFVFFDQLGPKSLSAGQGLDVRPHPHIGLATVTYLLDGEIMHRDSLGTVQPIRPGAVNWMTAGRGIVHSERTPPEKRRGPSMLAGLQLWVALPREHEETAPSFAHHPADRAAEGRGRGQGRAHHRRIALWRALAGGDAERSLLRRCGARVRRASRIPGRVRGARRLRDLGRDHARRSDIRAGAVPGRGARRGACACGGEASRLLLLGGARLDGPRHIWWNFVSSREERIEQAKADWKAGRFAAVPGESEFIPLPE